MTDKLRLEPNDLGFESRVPIDISTMGDNSIVAAVANEQIRIHELVLFTSAAVTVTLIEDDGSPVNINGSGFDFPANAGWQYSPYEPMPLKVGASFIINLGGNILVTGWLRYTQRTD